MIEFDQNKEFPNLFNMVAELLKIEGQPASGYDAVLKLIDKKISLILDSLNLPYVNPSVPGKIQTSGFFKELNKLSEDIVSDWNKTNNTNYSSKVYLGGGVVRALLAYVYKDVYEKLQRNIPANEINNYFDASGMSLGDYMNSTLSTPEYHLVRDAIVKEEHEYSKVFGVGSDMDIYVSVEPLSNELEEKLKFSIYSLVNSARNHLNVSNGIGATTNSFIPFADVAIRDKSLKETIDQGGSTLDWLSFLLTTPQKGEHRLQDPGPELFDSVDRNILHDFIKGCYSYILGNSAAKPKQIIRGLRALLEMPFLNIKDRTIIEKQILSLHGKEIDTKAAEQTLKMIRNSYFSAGNNRAYREINSLLGLLPDEYKIPMFTNQRRISKDRRISGSSENNRLIEKILLTNEEFSSKYCKVETEGQFMLYHSTKQADNMLSIFRGGFISTSKIGRYGSGLYCSLDESYTAKYGEYTFRLEFKPNKYNRILNLSDIGPNLMESLTKEAKENGCEDVNDLLANHYNIDIIVSDDRNEVMVQNSSAFSHPSSKEFIFSLRDQVLNSLEGALVENNLDELGEIIYKIKGIDGLLEVIDINDANNLKEFVISSLLNHSTVTLLDSRCYQLIIDILRDNRYKEQSNVLIEKLMKMLDTENAIEVCANFINRPMYPYPRELEEKIMFVLTKPGNTEKFLSYNSSSSIISFMLIRLVYASHNHVNELGLTYVARNKIEESQIHDYEYQNSEYRRIEFEYLAQLTQKLGIKFGLQSICGKLSLLDIKQTIYILKFCTEKELFTQIPELLNTMTYNLCSYAVHNIEHAKSLRDMGYQANDFTQDTSAQDLYSILISLMNKYKNIIDPFYISALISTFPSSFSKNDEHKLAIQHILKINIWDLLNKSFTNVNTQTYDGLLWLKYYVNFMGTIANDSDILSEMTELTWSFVKPILGPEVDFSENSKAYQLCYDLIDSAIPILSYENSNQYLVLNNIAMLLINNFSTKHKDLAQFMIDKLTETKIDVNSISAASIESILNKADELGVDTSSTYLQRARESIELLKSAKSSKIKP